MEFEMPRDCNGTELKVGDVLAMPGDNDARVAVNGFAVLPTFRSGDYDRNCVFHPDMWEVVARGEDANAETRASKRLEKLMAQLGVDSYGDARTAINELRQHQVTENARRWKDRAEFLSHKLADAEAVNEKQDIDNAFLRADLERMRAEIERLEARQLPEGVEWPVDADGVRIEVMDVLTHDAYRGTYAVESLALVPIVRSSSDVLRFACHVGEVPVAECMHHVQPEPAEPPDSWEKLEADVAKTKESRLLAACGYFTEHGEDVNDRTCSNCVNNRIAEPCIQIMVEDIVRRAKKLAGVS